MQQNGVIAPSRGTPHDDRTGDGDDRPSAPPSGGSGLPVVLFLAGMRCLVVGGGRVGARRARELAAAGASVTVVAPELDPALEDAAETGGGGIECLTRSYREGEASAYRLVVAATGDGDVDRAVVAEALAAGALVSSADGAKPGNVSLPAVHRDGPVTIAVSTGGTSPALAVWLRTRLAAALGPETATLAELAGEAREALRRSGAAGRLGRLGHALRRGVGARRQGAGRRGASPAARPLRGGGRIGGLR